MSASIEVIAQQTQRVSLNDGIEAASHAGHGANLGQRTALGGDSRGLTTAVERLAGAAAGACHRCLGMSMVSFSEVSDDPDRDTYARGGDVDDAAQRKSAGFPEQFVPAAACIRERHALIGARRLPLGSREVGR